MHDETRSDCELVDATPGTAVLFSYANANHEHWKMLGECIDNAFDANASHVDIRIGKRMTKGHEFIEVTDTGDGCDRPDVMVKLGGRRAHRTTRLGRYGIGLKEALFWWGGAAHLLSIVTTSGKVTTQIKADWGEVCRTGDWTHAIEKRPRAAEDGERGTKIRVRPLVHKMPEGKDWDGLVARLGYIYAPALKQGRSISLEKNGVRFPVQKWETPNLAEHISQTIDVDGKRVHVYAGIVAEGVNNARPGLTYWHGFRVILEHTKAGCGAFNTSRLCGFVELLDGWELTKNKDNISENTEALFEAVERVLTPLLEKASKASLNLEIEALRSRAEQLANAALGRKPDAKAKREQQENGKRGSVEPKNTGRKHRGAKNVQPGGSFARARAAQGSISIVFFDGDDETTIGNGDLTGRAINLNTRHPFIVQVRDEPRALATVAVAIWSATIALPNGEQGGFGGDVEKFLREFGSLTAKPMALDGAKVLALVKKETGT